MRPRRRVGRLFQWNHSDNTNRKQETIQWLLQQEKAECQLQHDRFHSSNMRTKVQNSSDGSNSSTDEKGYHVLMLMTSEDNPRKSRQDMITLASALLVAHFHVTIIQFQFHVHYHDAKVNDLNSNELSDIETTTSNATSVLMQSLREDVLIQMSFEEEMQFQEALKVEILYLKNAPPPSSHSACKINHNYNKHHPMEHCAIKQAPEIFKMLQERQFNNQLQKSHHPNTDLLIMDAGFLGGLLYSEFVKIPSIVWGSYQSLQLTVEHHPNWRPMMEWHGFYGIYRMALQRWYSLGLTGEFVKMNRLRHVLGFPRLKSPVDSLVMVSAMLVDGFPKDLRMQGDTTNEYENGKRTFGYTFVHRYSPLLPPFIPCLSPQKVSSQNDTSAIDHPILLVLPPPSDVSANWTRDMIRAITVARQSLKSYDDCAWDSWSCSNPFSHFRVVWIDDGQSNNTKFHSFPFVVPDFIYRETEHENLLDAIFRYPTTSVAMVEGISSTTHMASPLFQSYWETSSRYKNRSISFLINTRNMRVLPAQANFGGR
jgi:hypothetical protein